MCGYRTEGFIGDTAMEQRPNLAELSYLLELVPCNISDPDSSVYNFSTATAIDLILEYRDNMLTIANTTTIVLLCLYIPTFLLAFGGNVLVIYVVFKNPHMRRVKNLFLVNLALADILVTLLCIPMVTGQTVYRLWVYGPFMCKVSGFMQGLAVTCSIFTLSALSVDRYLAIKWPTSLKRISRKRVAVQMLLIIWIIAATFAGPLLFIRRVKTVEFNCLDVEFTYCIEDWPRESDRKVYGILVLVVIYVAPLSVVAVCYGMIGRTLCSDEFHRKSSDGSATIMLGRKRVARMLIALIIMFVICWLPYNACSLSLDINPDYTESQILPFTLWLGHAHSAINPVLYWFLNKSFRHCMRKVLFCRPDGKRSIATPSPQCNDGEALRLKDFPEKPDQQQFPNLRTRLQMRNSPVWMRRENVNVPRVVIQEPSDHRSKNSNSYGSRSPPAQKYLIVSKKSSPQRDTKKRTRVEINETKEPGLTSLQAGDRSGGSSSVSTNESTQPTSPTAENTRHGFCLSTSINV